MADCDVMDSGRAKRPRSIRLARFLLRVSLLFAVASLAAWPISYARPRTARVALSIPSPWPLCLVWTDWPEEQIPLDTHQHLTVAHAKGRAAFTLLVNAPDPYRDVFSLPLIGTEPTFRLHPFHLGTPGRPGAWKGWRIVLPHWSLCLVFSVGPCLWLCRRFLHLRRAIDPNVA